MNNLNLDENTMNNIKNMMDNGNFSDALSQISPEMIEKVSSMLNSNNSNQQNASNSSNLQNNSTNTTNNDANTNTNSTSGFDFSNIDAATIMKITSAFGKMNDKNDPRANLLYSLKPYLRDGKQEKLDQYVNLLNVSKIANILKDDKKENNSNV